MNKWPASKFDAYENSIVYIGDVTFSFIYIILRGILGD